MTESRIDSEWIALNAFRGLLKIASKGDSSKSTYDKALDFGGALYPELLGPDASLLRSVRESDTVKEYKQKATLLSIRERKKVEPLGLLLADIDELENLLLLAEKQKSDRSQVDQLKRKLALWAAAKQDLSPECHTENQLIFRDAYSVQRSLPEIGSGKGCRDLKLPDDNVLRIRVLHPDKPEHITGADIIYEHHEPYEKKARIVAVQYKLWDEKILRLSEPRLQEQLLRLTDFTCSTGICFGSPEEESYRFPCCASFLRPTDKLQRADQKFITTGEHLPICQISRCTTKSIKGTDILEYEGIKKTSLSSEIFEYLFSAGKIGSRKLDYIELTEVYHRFEISSSKDRVVIHAQEFDDAWA